MRSQRLERLVPYTPGEQPQDRSYLKLNTNENPYPPSPRVGDVLESFSAADLRRYPDPRCTGLRAAAAAAMGLEPENVFVGNGSDEVLSFAFFSFFDSTRGPLLFPRFSYSFFPVYCDFYDIEYQRVPLEADFTMSLARFLDYPASCGIVFPNPNAPTGIAVDRSAVLRLLEQYPRDRVVLVDEAYVDFGAQSCIELLREWPNLLVVQTFSKSKSLAGMRLGFAFGQPPLIEALSAAKDSFNSYPVDMIAQAIGVAALGDPPYYAEITSRIAETREEFAAALREAGWLVLPSKTNFVFASHPSLPGREVYRQLKERGILVRHFQIEGIDRFVRITVGLPEDMRRLLETVSELRAG